MSTHILGIRHHGPGSARAVKNFLEKTSPDIVLVEGPPEGDALLDWVTNEEMRPPVALLVYNPETPKTASFYPFAEFSPEWQAIRYAKEAGIPVRFMDLPAAHSLALRNEQLPEPLTENLPAEGEGPPDADDSPGETPAQLYRDPISHLAEAAGWSNGERWWEHAFEHRRKSDDVFEAVSEAMTALRSVLPSKDDRVEALREAWMRKTIRQAEREMFTNIAVICGAWHLPALTQMPKAKDDNELLKGLPKIKIEATWVPWTYGRLSYRSGYGAGINSPGWYHHVWHYPQDDGTRWLSSVATLFRSRGMDTSVAHVIEAVRLAESLASLRAYPKAGLEEMNEAALSVLCGGDDALLRLVHEELVVSNRIGTVPAGTPRPPLQADIDKISKSLRLAQTADFKDYTLDLRKDSDLARSVFLHRLLVLDIPWGDVQGTEGKGTFKEAWRLQWHPELALSVIEKGAWGNTLESAAAGFVMDGLQRETSLSAIAATLQSVLPADLPGAVAALSIRLKNVAAASHDVLELIKVIPGLARIVRYGNVRRTDADVVLQILDGIVTRTCIGLPLAACGIDEETAGTLTEDCNTLQQSIGLLQDAGFLARWQDCLRQMEGNEQTVPMLRGFAVRRLMDYGLIEGDALYTVLSRSTSTAVAPMEAAAWLEGFLKGSGTVLLLDEGLWRVVDDFIDSLTEETFLQILPLLRRSFAEFAPAERRKMGEKAAGAGSGKMATQGFADEDFNAQRAAAGIPVVLRLLGLSPINSDPSA